jgi:hypothetical protein
MHTPVRWLAGVLVAAVPALALAAEPDVRVRRLTAAIDRHVEADWQARSIPPAPPADDAEFCRRVYLDLVGRIPRVAEVRAFLDDPAADKRARLVQRLLTTPGFAAHWAARIRTEWLPQTLTDFRGINFGNQFEGWLRSQIVANTALDELVRKILVASVAVGQRGRVALDTNRMDREEIGIAAFYQANDVKPEQVAATVSRVFLGVKLECAQCHDHPFAPYSQAQFWEFAAFFGEFTPLPPISPSFVGPLPPQYEVNRLSIPRNNKSAETRVVTARYFDGSEPVWSHDRSPRRELADWLLSKDNPYFARNIANRVWAHFFGLGIVEPVDEPGDDNPPSHPGLLDELAAGLVESGFDVRVLIRAVTASRAYNLAGRQTDPGQADLRRFARMPLRGLTAHQIYDSYLAATGLNDPTPRNQTFFDPRNNVGRAGFQSVFALTVSKPTEAQTSILQALLMMNGKPIADQTSVANSNSLAAIIDAPFLDTPKQIEAVFLAALTRKPTPEEREKFASYVDRGGPTGDRKKALADVFWVLLNSTEFLFNH